MSIILVKKEIRRSLESVIETVCGAQVPKIPVQFFGTSLDRNGLKKFVKVGLPTYGDVKVLEVGTNPRFQGKGGLTLNVYTPNTMPPDENDDISRIIGQAFPYSQPLVRDGVSVIIDKIRPGAYGVDGAWITGLMTIDWTVYRRS